MPYGKPEAQLVARPSFRQSVLRGQVGRPPSGGKGKPAFLTKYKPPIGRTDTIRVLRGEYENQIADTEGNVSTQVLPYFLHTEHYHSFLKKYLNCSAGPLVNFRGQGEPCHGCDMFWEGKNSPKKTGPMSKGDKTTFSILHYGMYANVPQVDFNTKQVRMNPNTNPPQPYMEWRFIPQHERQQYRDVETRDGSALHWSLGRGHLDSLFYYATQIGKSCLSCQSKDTIRTVHWECTNCEAPLLDPETSTFSPKELQELVENPGGVTCSECRHVGMLKEVIACERCESPVRADLFDVDLEIEATEDANEKGTTLRIVSWSAPRIIDPRFADIAKPLPLPDMFQPTPLERQVEILSGAPARPQAAPGSFSKPYAGRPVLSPPK